VAHWSVPGQLRSSRTCGGVVIVAGGSTAPSGQRMETAMTEVLFAYDFSTRVRSPLTVFTTSYTPDGTLVMSSHWKSTVCG
jgi:hypothetical protein